MQVQFGDLKKGEKIKSAQLGALCSGVLLESPRQGKGLKSAILIDCKGSELGLFDEMGSVYARDVKLVERDGKFLEVVGQPKCLDIL